MSDETMAELVRGRIGVDFDGECHLTEAEACQVIATLERLAAENAELREALRPFGKALDDWGDEPEQSDRRNLYDHPAAIGIGLGDLRRARQALGGDHDR